MPGAEPGRPAGRGSPPPGTVVSIDAGTTGIRAVTVDADGTFGRHLAYRELTQHYPRPGWVEHDPTEIWDATVATLTEVAHRVTADGGSVAAIGITNQRETAVAWSRSTGDPLHRAVVWQDRRTAARCDELERAGHGTLVRERTGLVLDPYFSATKFAWMLGEGGVPDSPDLALGTVDAWLLWRLTGGPGGGVHATDPSNASRTSLFDLDRLDWSEELADLFGVPRRALPEVRPTSGRFGVTDPGSVGGLRVPVSGIAGDQQSALFGHGCLDAGMAKNTYGTGSFVLVHAGTDRPRAADGLLTSVGWTVEGATTYVLEGSIFATGAAVQWLRDGLGLIGDAAEVGPLAESVPDSAGIYVVPAFAGLGSPHWDPYARGTVVGLTRGSDRARICRAVVEAMAYQTRDVVDSMRSSGVEVSELRVDGGASVMDLLCQFQADLLGVPVHRPAVAEATALGAAYLAGLAEGVWASAAEATAARETARTFTPGRPGEEADAMQAEWHRAVERARGWAAPTGGPAQDATSSGAP